MVILFVLFFSLKERIDPQMKKFQEHHNYLAFYSLFLFNISDSKEPSETSSTGTAEYPQLQHLNFPL